MGYQVGEGKLGYRRQVKHSRKGENGDNSHFGGSGRYDCSRSCRRRS